MTEEETEEVSLSRQDNTAIQRAAEIQPWLGLLPIQHSRIREKTTMKKNLYCKDIHYSCQLGCGVFIALFLVENKFEFIRRHLSHKVPCCLYNMEDFMKRQHRRM